MMIKHHIIISIDILQLAKTLPFQGLEDNLIKSMLVKTWITTEPELDEMWQNPPQWCLDIYQYYKWQSVDDVPSGYVKIANWKDPPCY